MPDRLTDEQIAEGLARIPQWARVGDQLVRDFQFADFVAALGFIVEVGALAERANHHPEIVNTYGHVRLSLSTHDAGGITVLDLRLAEAISARVPWLRTPSG
ncbi:MAG: 4a-hydroxytetrahydrobiopterin dehydratase [Chloroflexi bacterium]|nr:MAG: 4a-hydroxytetrahydrobiopterin dehydratase [Chloroflexota bacterium]